MEVKLHDGSGVQFACRAADVAGARQKAEEVLTEALRWREEGEREPLFKRAEYSITELKPLS